MAQITKEFIENHFKHHNTLTIYQNQIPLVITKAWHLNFSGGHYAFDLDGCEDLVELCKQRGLTLKPVASMQDDDGDNGIRLI